MASSSSVSSSTPPAPLAPISRKRKASDDVEAITEMANPFGFTASKYGIPEEFLKGRFQELQNYYDASVLTKVCLVKVIKPLAEDQLPSTLLDIQDVQTDSNWTCKAEHRGEFLAQSTHPDQPTAKDSAAKAALLVLQKHPLHFQHFLTQVPSAEGARCTSKLLNFFKTNADIFEDKEVNGISRTLGIIAGGAPVIFEFDLTYLNKNMNEANEKPIVLAKGRSDGAGCSQRRAREDASRKVLRMFATIVQKPKEIYFNILLSKVVCLELDKVMPVRVLVPIILGYYAERLTDGAIADNMALVPLNGEKDLDEKKE